MALSKSSSLKQISLFPSEAVGLSAAPAKPLPSYLKDHRKRLRERFHRAGLAAMPDYELLELVLFRALRRQDVKPVARCLLERFHDFSEVISVPIDQLLSVPGIGGAVVTELKIVEAAAHRLSQTRVLGRQILSSWDRLLEHCQITIACRALEGFWVLFLDRKNVLIVQEQQSEGTVDHVPVYQREILKRALQLNASALILVHNHPSGNPQPSPQDRALTAQIAAAADAVGICIHDHLIIGRGDSFSFRSEGLL